MMKETMKTIVERFKKIVRRCDWEGNGNGRETGFCHLARNNIRLFIVRHSRILFVRS